MMNKGEYGGKMWQYMQNLNKEGILTNKEVQNLCILSRAWPKAFMVEHFTDPLKENGETEPDEDSEIIREIK